MKVNRKNVFVIGVIALAVVLGGCLGTPQPPKPVVTNVSGTVVAPIAPESSIMTMAASNFVPIPGATVQALELPDLNPIGNPVITDEQGRYTITGLPKGVSVIVMATKHVDGGTLRITTYVPEVREQTTANADPVTSLATEVLAERARNHQKITIQEWNEAQANAEAFIAELDEIDLRVEGSLLAGTIGSGLTDNELGERILPPDPETEQPATNVDKAKAMVRALRDAGYSLERTFETQLQAHSESIELEVGPVFSNVAVGLGELWNALLAVASVMEDPSGGKYECDFTWDCVRVGSTKSGQWMINVGESLTYVGEIRAYSESTGNPSKVSLAVVATRDGKEWRSEATITALYEDIMVPEVAMEAFLGIGDPHGAKVSGVAYVDYFHDTPKYDGIVERIDFRGDIEGTDVLFTGDAVFELDWSSNAEYWLTYLKYVEADGLLVTPTLEIGGQVELSSAP